MSEKRLDGANGATGAGFAFAALSALALSFGSPLRAETLLDAVDLAYSTNPALRAERERARAVDEGIAQARAGILPTVTLSGQGGLSQTETKIGANTSNSTVGRPQNADPESVTAQVVQPIFQGGRTYYGVRQASAAAKAAHATYRSSEQQFLIGVITAFMDVRRDEESVRIRENNVSVLRKQVEAAQARFDVGEGTKTDIAQAEARRSGGDAGLAQARAQLDASRATYERIVGQKPGTLDTPPALPVLATSLDDAINAALDANPDLRAAKLNADAAKFAVGVSRSQLLPQAEIIAQAGINRENYSFSGLGGAFSGRDRVDSSAILGRVTIPLFDAGLARSQTRQSKINSYRADALEQDAKNRVVEGVNAAWSRYLAAQVVQTASEAQVSANETAFEGVQQEQQVGLRSFLDVLDAEQELLDSRLAAVNAQHDSYIAAHALLATYGGLSVESLQARVGQYNPEKYYNRAKRTIISTGVPKLKSKPPK